MGNIIIALTIKRVGLVQSGQHHHAACLAEERQISIYSLWFDPTGGSNPRPTGLEMYAQTITSSMWLKGVF
jgi:hypothetical protein